MSDNEQVAPSTKTSVTNYEYINFLVERVQKNYAAKEDYEWYFNKVVELYEPIITNAYFKLKENLGPNRTWPEVRQRLLEIVFMALIEYDPTFRNDSNKEGFTRVYFSNYLKKKMFWGGRRLVHPNRIEYEDMAKTGQYCDINDITTMEEVQLKLVDDRSHMQKPISPNFISLCRHTQKTLMNDQYADLMFLKFGYDMKNKDIAKVLDIYEEQSSLVNRELLAFWREHVDEVR